MEYHPRFAQEAKADESLITTEEAAELLGVSRFRINAMLANGVLAGCLVDGAPMVSAASVNKRRDNPSTDDSGRSLPQGRFAHNFLRVEPTEGFDYLIEVDGSESDEVERAYAYADCLRDDESIKTVNWLTYQQARKYLDKEGVEVLVFSENF